VTRRAAGARSASRRPRAGAAACGGRDDLWPFLDAELPPARARAVVRHVADCTACTARLRRLAALLAACRDAGCRALPPAVRARATARARQLVRQAAPPTRRAKTPAGRSHPLRKKPAKA